MTASSKCGIALNNVQLFFFLIICKRIGLKAHLRKECLQETSCFGKKGNFDVASRLSSGILYKQYLYVFVYKQINQNKVFWIGSIESLTQASIFSPPQLASSLLDSVVEAQRVQVSTRRAAVNSSQPKHSQNCPNVST